MKDKTENNLKEENEDVMYFDTLGDRPYDLGDPLSCETDMKMTKSERSSRLVIKVEEGCQKSRTQCSICGLEFIAKGDLKSHMTEEHVSFPEKVATNQ